MLQKILIFWLTNLSVLHNYFNKIIFLIGIQLKFFLSAKPVFSM